MRAPIAMVAGTPRRSAMRPGLQAAERDHAAEDEGQVSELRCLWRLYVTPV